MSTRQRIRQLERLGLRVERTGSGHLRAWSPYGVSVVVATTPGGGRAAYNERAALRRLLGREVPATT
jgi:hypothetical protein